MSPFRKVHEEERLMQNASPTETTLYRACKSGKVTKVHSAAEGFGFILGKIRTPFKILT